MAILPRRGEVIEVLARIEPNAARAAGSLNVSFGVKSTRRSPALGATERTMTCIPPRLLHWHLCETPCSAPTEQHYIWEIRGTKRLISLSLTFGRCPWLLRP